MGVGQFDVIFSFGPVGFAGQSTVKLFRDDKLIAEWQEGRWPDPSFYDVMNTDVKRCDIKRPVTVVAIPLFSGGDTEQAR